MTIRMIDPNAPISFALAQRMKERGEYLSLMAIERDLDRLRREAHGVAYALAKAALLARGRPAGVEPDPAMVRMQADGLLFSLVSPGEQHALSLLMNRK